MLHDGVPIDWKKAPIPEGRTLIACQRMLQRAKDSVKAETTVLKGGAGNDSTPKRGRKKAAENGTPKTTPKKRIKNDDHDDDDAFGFVKKMKMEHPEEDGEDNAGPA
jgi:hypothetical protein